MKAYKVPESKNRPAAAIGGAEKDAVTTPNENRKTHKNYSIGLNRSGRPDYADNRPSNKLSKQSAASLANRNGDNEVCYGVPGGPDGGKESTGQTGEGSRKYSREGTN